MLAARDAALVRHAFRGMAVDKSRFPADVLDTYGRAALRPGALTAMVNWYRAMRRFPPAPGPRSRVEAPVLVIWGEADTALGLETLDGIEQDVAQVTVHRLPGVSHWVQQEAPEAVNAILAGWLPRGDALPPGRPTS